MLTLLLILAQGTWAFSGSGTSESPYLIASASDWSTLASNVNSGTNYVGKSFRLTNDISVTTMVGSSESNSFRGTFDGYGHTLTINYNTTSDYTAPFRYIQGATFKNLKVTGSITTTMNLAAGIAGLNTGATATFEQCVTDIIINSSSSTVVGWGRYDYHGGLLARTIHVDAMITDCVCGGNVNGSSSSNSNCASFVGVAENCTVHATRCLSTTSYTNVNKWNSLSHCADNAYRAVNVFYYVNANDAANVGEQVTTSQVADGSLITALQDGRSTTVWVHYAGQPMLNIFAFSKAADGYYLIGSEQEWRNFASLILTIPTANARMTADISVTTMVGNSDSNSFSGTFDGQGHTLTFTKGSVSEPFAENSCAPFRHIKNAIITNLHVAGTIYTSAQKASGLVADSHGALTITGCRSSVNINSSKSGDGTHGGLVAITTGSGNNVTIGGCVFDGSFATTSSTNSCGGFVGWTGENTPAIMNSLMKPGCVAAGMLNNTFARWQSGYKPTITNCYYVTTDNLPTDQGKLARSISAGDDVSISNLGNGTEYDVSGITAYAHGIKYGGSYYAGNGDEVSLTLSHGEKSGFSFSQYSVTGGGTLDDATSNTPTLTMTDANQVINAEWIMNVASVTTSGDVTTYYTAFSDALAAWEVNSTLKLLTSVETASTITVSATSTLDLNGYGIKMTGTGPVIRVGASKTFTLNDSNPTATHKFTIGSNLLATLDEENGTLTIYGGYITGGQDCYGCAIDVSTNSSSNFIMNAGTLIGNNNGSGDNLGTVCVARDAQKYANTFTINGGTICYNNAVGIGVLPEGTANINGGKIHHNNGAGIRMWHSKLLTLNNVEITDNTASGILVDARQAAIQVQGRTIITNNTLNNNPADVNYDRGDNNRTRPLAIVGELHSEARIGIYYNPTDSYSAIGSVFTSGLSGNGTASNFFSNLDSYRVNINADGEALLTVKTATLNQATDNSTFISTHDGYVYDVTLTRTLQTGGWNTFCVPFDISSSQITSKFGAGTLVRTLGSSAFNSSTKELTLNFTNASSIEAGKPYLVYIGSETAVSNPTFEYVTIVSGTTTTETTYANFMPVMNPTSLTGGDKSILFVTGGDKLTYPSSTGNINGFRAYFLLKGVAAAGARAFTMNFDDGETTSIKDAVKSEELRIKSYYDLQGRKIDMPTQKGVYIVNGRKVVIK